MVNRRNRAFERSELCRSPADVVGAVVDGHVAEEAGEAPAGFLVSDDVEFDAVVDVFTAGGVAAGALEGLDLFRTGRGRIRRRTTRFVRGGDLNRPSVPALMCRAKYNRPSAAFLCLRVLSRIPYVRGGFWHKSRRGARGSIRACLRLCRGVRVQRQRQPAYTKRGRTPYLREKSIAYGRIHHRVGG